MSSGRVVLAVYDYSEYERMFELGRHREVWEKITTVCGLAHSQHPALSIDPKTGQVSASEIDWRRYLERREVECQEQIERDMDT